MAFDSTPPDDSAEPVSTGIAGLDQILRGGLPSNRLYVVEGVPGTGKTTLALQFLLEGRRRGEAVLYVTLSESKTELLDAARAHGWSLDDIQIYELEALREGEEDRRAYTVFHPSEVELGETINEIYRVVEQAKPVRVVFDSLSELRLLAQSPLRYRREILGLKQFFAGRRCTVLLLDDRTAQEDDQQLQSISHGLIRLERVNAGYGVTRRRLHVTKLRGVGFREGFHDYSIKRGGLEVYPRLIAAEHGGKFVPERTSSGHAALDALLGGGLDRGSSALIIGPAGCGKSTMGTQFVGAALLRGEPAACYIFEESRATFLERAAGLGMPLNEYLDSGLLHIRKIDPAELSPGEFASDVCDAVERAGVRLVLLDSVNGYLNAMPNEQFLLLQMHELLTYLGQQGVITLLVLAQAGLVGKLHSPVDLGYLADTLLLLRYFEADGHVRQAFSVLKKRHGAHERSIRELKFGPHGIEISPPLRDFEGVLTGVARYSGSGLPFMVSGPQD